MESTGEKLFMLMALSVNTLSSLFLSIAYLPLKSNALITYDLTNANFSKVYPSQEVLGETTEFIPGWINDTAWARESNPETPYKQVFQRYEYTRYGYARQINETIIGPELPSNLRLEDTNFCDEYSFGLWGYWATSKTNGVSHSVLQSPLDSSINTSYLEPYALKNHTEFKEIATIWNPVKSYIEPSPDYGFLEHFRLALILSLVSSISLTLTLIILMEPEPDSGRLHSLRSVLLGLFAFSSFALAMASFVFTLIAVGILSYVQDRLQIEVNSMFSHIGATCTMGIQMQALLGTTVALKLGLVVGTIIHAAISGHK